MNRLFICIGLVAVAACSNRGIYENMQIHQRNECAKEPTPLYQACIARVNRSYDEYQRERKEQLKQ